MQQVLRFSARRRHDNSGAGEEADVVGIAPELLGRCPDLADRPRQQLPRSLDDVDAAVINTNYAVPAGLIPGKDSIAIELPANNPYNNFIAVRERDRDAPWVSKLCMRSRTTPSGN